MKTGKPWRSGPEKGEELLKQMISMDEGACMLGECALIPYDSPISNSGVLFYNTLFDENASCHLALGHGFNECLKGYENYTNEQCKEHGINDSMIHVDFMIGLRGFVHRRRHGRRASGCRSSGTETGILKGI